MFRRVKGGAFAVNYWDGSSMNYGGGPPAFTLAFYKRPGMKAVTEDPVLAFGEAYMDGVWDLSGEWEAVAGLLDRNKGVFGERNGVLHRLQDRLRKGTPIAQQKKDIRHHYDLGNDFYSLWLDETLSYSCGYFEQETDTLYQAQVQKIDHILKKLLLKPGETLLDIGSGWGWLIIRAAQEYGVNGLGITLSEEQYKATRERVQELGLTGRVEVELIDYRELAATGRTFDKIVSVGMFEHVGQANYPQFMAVQAGLLKTGGLGMLHTITHLTEAPVNAWTLKYIFPGGHIPSLREVVGLLPEANFHLLDLESLRQHYALTLDRWVEGFEQHVDQVREKYGERFVRMWRLYLRASAAGFRSGGLDVHQLLFSKGINNDLPLTRRHLYN
ncbi:MAG: cyclopropane-fatty-acyl-phospholipid synthase [Heliobacteriaceae bacterium]|nr:cyclopropane-fatty-acyl-phospholipid synthase [Heliobacteriaceae bacterium]